MANLITLYLQFIANAKQLTFPQIFKVAVVTLLIISGYVIWENRQPLYEGIRANSTVRTMLHRPVSPNTISTIRALLEKPSSIIAVELVAVDFNTNTYAPVLFDTTSPQLSSIVSTHELNKISPQPFFVVGNEPNNTRNVGLINGDFLCYTYDELIKFTRFPSITPYANYVCSISVPPYPGYFSGYINVYVTHTPSSIEISDIRSAVRKLSIEIYDNEFGKY